MAYDEKRNPLTGKAERHRITAVMRSVMGLTKSKIESPPVIVPKPPEPEKPKKPEKLYRYFDRHPEGTMEYGDISRKSRANLDKLSELFGIKFEDKALVWIDKYGVREIKAWRILGKMDGKPIEFWRRDKSSGIGDTLLFINELHLQVSWIFGNSEFPPKKLEKFKEEIGDTLYNKWTKWVKQMTDIAHATPKKEFNSLSYGKHINY